MNLSSKLALPLVLLAAVTTSVNAAYDDAGTDYTKQTASSYIDSGPAGDSLNMVDFLLCVMDASRATIHPESSYSVLVDESICMGEASITPKMATQTLTTSGSSNPTEDAPFYVKNWFKTSEGMSVVALATITSGATLAAPNGAFTMNWKAVAPASRVGNKGSLTFKLDGTMSYVENETNDGGTNNALSYVHGTLAADGSSGNLRIKGKTYDNTGNQGSAIYRFMFDSTHVRYDTDGSNEACYDRTAANQTTTVYGYQLFDSAGAEKALSGPFGFTYTSAGDELNGWAHPSGVWLEGEHDQGTWDKPTEITRRSDSVVYNICYDDDWASNSGNNYDNGFDDNVAGGATSCGTGGDGVAVHLTNQSTTVPYVFDDPIRFDTTVNFKDRSSGDTITAIDIYNSYDGTGSSLNLGWVCLLPQNQGTGTWIAQSWSGGSNTCNGAIDYRPQFNLPDGTALTAGGVTYHVKSIDERTFLKQESDLTPCAALNLASTPADAGYTKELSIEGVDITWAQIPTLTDANVIKYIQGVAQ